MILLCPGTPVTNISLSVAHKKKKSSFSSFVYALFRMPVCLSLFYRLSVEQLIVGRAETISPTSAISHSYLITKGSAKK